MDIAILTVLNKIGELGSFASRECSRLKDVDVQVSDLRSKLEFLMAWIQVAEEGNRMKRDQLVSVWVSQLRGAVFDAEDIVDDYIQELCQYQPGAGAESRRPPAVEARARRGRTCVPSCFPFRSVGEVAVRHGLSRQIGQVLRRLDEIQKNSMFNMQPRVDALADAVQVFDRPTADTLKCGDPWTLVGLDDYTQSIISLLHEDNGKRETVVVVGESGIGKTTAARAVLRSQDVQKRFDVCAWVCLPPKSRVDRYLNLILEQAHEQTHCDCRKRGGVLDKMKLLVVLDGMDSMDELMDVLTEVPRGARESRIMVTTQLQSKKIEQCIPGIRPVEIKCLKRPDCLQLLCRGLSGKPRRVYDAHKDKFDDKIYDISGGLPLAVVLLRGLVYFKDHEAQWNEVFDLLKSYQHKRLIKRILTVSYSTMPTVLKLCFLYFAAMPPNVYIDLDKLQRLWSAEGILKSTSRVMGVEEEGCLDILVSRGLVQRVEGGTKLCIHQSVHGFAKTMAHETGFMEAHSQFDIRDTPIVRSLSVHNYVDRRVYMDNVLPKTRTLLGDFAEDFCVDEAAHPSGSQTSSSKGLKNQSRLEFLCQSKFLRVLDLQGIQLGELPDNIGRLIHLRYIGLRSCGLKDLPSSVAKLLNLETLDITDNDIQMVADGFWKIEKLKHVLAKKLALPISSASMGSVTNLETLHGVTLSSVGTQENCLLNKMSKLLSLAVVSVTAANVRTLEMALEEISGGGLRHLKIAGDCCPVTFPCTRLCSLELDGKASSDEAPAQLNSSCSFTKCKLLLRSSCMSQVLLDSFLSNLLLSEVALLHDSFIGSKLLLRKGPFCDLEKLRIGNLKQLEELVIESETTLLKTIEIFGCPNMKIIRGLKNSEYLTNVVLFDMPEIVAHIKTQDKELFNKIKHVRTEAWESET